MASLAAEVERRLVHASGGVVPVAWAVGLIDWWVVQLVFGGGLAVVLVMEAGRLSGRLDLAIYDRLTREYEQNNLAGYALYMVSMALVAALFSPRIATPAMLMLALGDPVSGLLGSGELRTVKRVRVLVTMFVTCTLLALPFVPPVAAAFGGVAAMLADGVKPVPAGYVIDDNLTIPPAAALAISVGLAVTPLV